VARKQTVRNLPRCEEIIIGEWGIGVDLNFVARILASVDETTIGMVLRRRSDPIVMGAGQWRAVVMPMLLSATDERTKIDLTEFAFAPETEQPNV
jgi:hypothetical protein